MARLRGLAGQLRATGLPDSGGHRRGPRPVVWAAPPRGETDSADPAAPRQRARLDWPEYINDLSLIPWLCWAHDRSVAHRGRTAGVAHLPAAELAIAGP